MSNKEAVRKLLGLLKDCLLYTSYKSEIISDETAFYANEKNEISGICNQFLNGKTDQKLFCNEMKDRLNDYYGSRYELRNQPEAVESRVNNMLSKLQHMYAL